MDQVNGQETSALLTAVTTSVMFFLFGSGLKLIHGYILDSPLSLQSLKKKKEMSGESKGVIS